MKLVLSPNPYRDQGLRTSLAARRILEQDGAEVVFSLPFDLEENSHFDLPEGVEMVPLRQALQGADFLVCFGGDGTLLHAARAANACHVPLLGVNMGSVGFMAELEPGELPLLSRLLTGQYDVEERMMLDVKVVRDGKVVFSDTALNDAVLTKGAVARVLELEVTGDRVPIFTFSGDGLILSTPTGSTAYSMAAGGPIVEPSAENLIVTPICAHSLRVRPMVLDGARNVGVRLARGSRRSAYLSVDGGHAFKMFSSDRADIRRSEQTTRLIRLTGRSFYELIHQKLGRG